MNRCSIAVFLSFILSSSLLPMAVAQAAKPASIQEPSKINLNKATVAELTGSIKGIGKKRAEAIVAYRDSHNGFKSVNELGEVKGLGAHFVEKNQEQLSAVYTLK